MCAGVDPDTKWSSQSSERAIQICLPLCLGRIKAAEWSHHPILSSALPAGLSLFTQLVIWHFESLNWGRESASMRARNQIPSIERTCMWDGTDRLWTVRAYACICWKFNIVWEQYKCDKKNSQHTLLEYSRQLKRKCTAAKLGLNMWMTSNLDPCCNTLFVWNLSCGHSD